VNPVRCHSVLIVEDSEDDYNITVRAFKKSGADVRIYRCEDGDDALAYLYKLGEYSQDESVCRPDIILLDLNLEPIAMPKNQLGLIIT
jgi:two-component system response regulator